MCLLKMIGRRDGVIAPVEWPVGSKYFRECEEGFL